MRVIKTTNMEVSMMEQIEDHMKIHNISFAEFIRRAVASYLDHNQTESIVVINNSKLDSKQDSSPEPIEQPPEIKPEANKDNKNDFNWDDIKL